MKCRPTSVRGGFYVLKSSLAREEQLLKCNASIRHLLCLRVILM